MEREKIEMPHKPKRKENTIKVKTPWSYFNIQAKCMERRHKKR